MADPLSIETWRRIFKRYGRWFGWGLTVVFGLPLVVGFGMSQYSGMGRGASVATTQAATVATVNGDPITHADINAARQSIASRMRSEGQSANPQPGPAYAEMEGMAINEAVQNAIIAQEAKRRHLQPSNADIDARIAKEREQLGHDITDSQWSDFLVQNRSQTPDEYREALAKALIPQALFDALKADQKVTDDEARQQNAQVKYAIVLISTPSSSSMFAGMQKKSLPDAEAQKKAQDLLAKARAGADIAAIARANSGAFSAKQGGIEDRGEFQTSPNMPESLGSLGYGKDFDSAIHRTTKGQFTDVIKVSGFQPGYAFAKVVDRNLNTPKNFDVKKAVDDLKGKRAMAGAETLIKDGVKRAKINFVDLDEKVYYDNLKFQMADREAMMAQLNRSAEPGAPTQADTQKQEGVINAEFEAMLKRHPDDATAALMVAQNLKRSRTPLQGAQNHDRLISLYETALNTVEDHNLRFELGGYYAEKKDFAKADAQYARIGRLLAAAPPYDTATIKEALPEHQRLVGAFRSINKPDEAAAQQAIVDKLNKQIADEKQKSAAAAAARIPDLVARARAEAAQAAAPHGHAPGSPASGSPAQTAPATPAGKQAPVSSAPPTHAQ